MWRLGFHKCPHCGNPFSISGYWLWTFLNPFHWFGKRFTKCPLCGKRSWLRWDWIHR